MTPTTKCFDDSAGPDADGSRDYAYVGTLFDFEDGLGRGFIVRVYDDSPEEASFLSSYEKVGKEKIRRAIAHVPYEDNFFMSVVRHLLQNSGIRVINALTSDSGGYEPVKIQK